MQMLVNTTASASGVSYPLPTGTDTTPGAATVIRVPPAHG
jgi:hypothetical protein